MKYKSSEEETKAIKKGLEKAYEKMAKFKKEKGTPLVVSENGKVKLIKPEDIPPTISCS